MDVEPIIEGVQIMAQMVRPTRDTTGRLYLGSIDPFTAINWAKECGHRIYSKEWREFASKKLKSNEFSKFRAQRDRKYH